MSDSWCDSQNSLSIAVQSSEMADSVSKLLQSHTEKDVEDILAIFFWLVMLSACSTTLLWIMDVHQRFMRMPDAIQGAIRRNVNQNVRVRPPPNDAESSESSEEDSHRPQPGGGPDSRGDTSCPSNTTPRSNSNGRYRFAFTSSDLPPIDGDIKDCQVSTHG